MIELDTIFNEDCLQGMKRIPDGSVDCIVTDPPYIIGRSHGGSVNDIKKFNVSLEQLDDAHLREGYDMEAFAKEVRRLQGGKVNAYIWCNKAQIADYFKIYVEGMKCKFEIICWHKQNALPTYFNKYLSDTEYCLYFHSGGGASRTPQPTRTQRPTRWAASTTRTRSGTDTQPSSRCQSYSGW